MNEKVRVRIFVSGMVQGVFYRISTQKKARSLGLKGWVRNLFDGRVEAVAEGNKEKIEELINWCHKGPSGARVDEVKVRYEDHQNEFDSFGLTY